MPILIIIGALVTIILTYGLLLFCYACGCLQDEVERRRDDQEQENYISRWKEEHNG